MDDEGPGDWDQQGYTRMDNAWVMAAPEGQTSRL